MTMVRPRNRRYEVPDDGSDGSDVDVAKPMHGVDFNHDGGGVAVEEFVVDPENELVVPSRIGVALAVDTCRKFPLLMNPSHRVGPHFATTYGLQILGGNHIDFQ